jgi:hypothetical protein
MHAIFHHDHSEAEAEEDADLPAYDDGTLPSLYYCNTITRYDDPKVAPMLAAVKGGLKKAAPFAFLNYIFLLTIL